MSPRPPPVSVFCAGGTLLPGADPAGALPGWPVKLLSALYASSPITAIVTGDMPLLLALPRGPFCIPLRTSIKPIFASIENDDQIVTATTLQCDGRNMSKRTAEPSERPQTIKI